jgi:leucyl aminopeptidase (aminopeptidase T)
MTIIVPDISTRLKPDLIPIVQTIYREFCNLQRDARVLVMSDSRTPDYIVASFHGVASAMGAEAVTLQTDVPYGGPTYQPMVRWPKALAAAAKESDLLVDLAVGYADFVVEAMDRGARVIMPGDGIGGPYLDDMLMRTIRDADIHQLRRNADWVAEQFTAAKTCTLLSGDDDELVVDLTDLQGNSGCGFLWDADKNDWKTNYGILPPAQPGVTLPRGRVSGTVTVDGTVLWHQIYHEEPRTPLKLRFEAGRLVGISGDRYLSNRLRNWLEEMGDDGAWEGPNHLNIGINPNAVLSQNQEWERVFGAVTCGMGDMSVSAGLYARGVKLEWAKSRVHWDWTVMQPTLKLDGRVIAENGRLLVPAGIARR